MTKGFKEQDVMSVLWDISKMDKFVLKAFVIQMVLCIKMHWELVFVIQDILVLNASSLDNIQQVTDIRKKCHMALKSKWSLLTHIGRLSITHPF